MSKKRTLLINCYNCGAVCEVADFGEGSHRQWCADCLADRAERYRRAVAEQQRKEKESDK